MKNSLKLIDSQIKQFQKIVDNYPNNNDYKETLNALIHKRMHLVDQIGRKIR